MYQQEITFEKHNEEIYLLPIYKIICHYMHAAKVNNNTHPWMKQLLYYMYFHCIAPQTSVLGVFRYIDVG